MHLIQHGAVQIVTTAEIIVHGGDVDARLPADHLACGVGIAVFGKKAHGRTENLAARGFAVFTGMFLTGKKQHAREPLIGHFPQEMREAGADSPPGGRTQKNGRNTRSFRSAAGSHCSAYGKKKRPATALLPGQHGSGTASSAPSPDMRRGTSIRAHCPNRPSAGMASGHASALFRKIRPDTGRRQRYIA